MNDRDADNGRPPAPPATTTPASFTASTVGQDRGEREWLAAVLDSMTDEVYFTAPDGRYTYANPAAMREFGHDNVAGVHVADIVAKLHVMRPDGSPRPLDEAPPLRALQGEVIRDEEHMVRTPRTGELRHRQVSSAPVRNAHGEIIGAVSVVRDITERKRYEAAVAQELEDTRLLRDLAAQIVDEDNPQQLFEDILDVAMRIAKADGGTIQLLDERTRELIFAARRGLDIALTSQFERVDASSGSPCGKALAQGTRCYTLFDDPSLPDPDGGLRAHFEFGLRSAQSTPLISRSGRVLGMFSTHWKMRRELTERELRFLDLLARQAADHIERMQSDTALRQREIELREADRHKDEFIAVLAHELRNPLVPIRNGIELLRSAAEKPEVVESVRPMMERQIGHMVHLIDDLLDVARISAGKIELRRESVSLGAIIANAVEATRTSIAAAKLQFVQRVTDEDCLLHADPTRLTQVVSNVLQNAAKYTPAGGRITLTARRLNADRAMVSVRDTGIGIAQDQLPQVFNLFAQFSKRTRANEGGLGVGLALARRLVEMHGGTITAQSEGPNKGSEFTITLPTSSAGSHVVAAGGVHAGLHGIRVLIVDDNQDAADSMALLVGMDGGETEVAYGGEAALAAIEGFKPHVVLLDIGMPVMDGYEVCRRIRLKHRDDIVLIAVSGWGQDMDKRQAERAGFDAHLTKPADPMALGHSISRLVRR